jgi:hypothetical protein
MLALLYGPEEPLEQNNQVKDDPVSWGTVVVEPLVLK